MPDYTRGGGEALGFAVEANYNDGIQSGDALNWVTPISNTLDTVPDVTAINDMGDDASGLASRKFSASLYVQGEIEFVCSFDQFGMLHRALWGSVSTAADTPSAGLHTHTYTFVLNNPASLALVEQRQDTAGAKKERKSKGVQIASGSYTVDARGFVSVTLSLFGNLDSDWGSAAETAAPATPDIADIPLGKHGGTLSWNSSTYPLETLTISVERQIGPNRFVFGSNAILEDHASENTRVTMEATLTPTDYSLDAAHSAVTQSDAVIAFTSGTHVITWSLEDANIETRTRTRNFGPDSLSLTFDASAGGTFGAKMDIVNDQANAVVTQNTAA